MVGGIPLPDNSLVKLADVETRTDFREAGQLGHAAGGDGDMRISITAILLTIV